MNFGRDGYLKWVLSFTLCVLIIISPAIADSPTIIKAPTVHLSDEKYSIGSIYVSNLNDVGKIQLVLKFDHTTAVVETIKPNTSVISNIELEIDSYYYDEGSVIYNGGYSAGTVRADLNFPEGASFQNSTPILDVVFRPTNKTGETPLSWEGPIGDSYYLKTGAMTPIKFDYYRDGELISNGMGAPFPYRGNITAPELVVEPGYTGVGQIYVGDLENIRRLHIGCSYNISEIRPHFEVNQTFTNYDYSIINRGGIFYSNENVSIIEPQAVIDMSMAPTEEGYWDVIMNLGCSYMVMNRDGVPVQYPFKTLNNGSINSIQKSKDTTIQIRNVALSSNQSAVGVVEASNLTDVEKIQLVLNLDPTIAVVETIKPNTSVISNIELQIDSYYYDEGSVIYNGGDIAGTVRADLNFPEGASFQNSTPILDVVFRPTNETGEASLSWEGPIGDSYYLKTGAMTPIKFDYYRDGELISNGMGAPFPYRGNITAPELVVEPGYTGVGQIYVGDIENIRRLHIGCSYNFSEIRPNFEVNRTFTKFEYSVMSGGGYTGGMMSADAIFYSNENVSIIEPQAVFNISMTTREEGYWDVIMNSGCSYMVMNRDGVPVEYPFKTLNDGSINSIQKSKDTTIQIRNVTLSSNQSVVGVVEASNLTDVEKIQLVLKFDHTTAVVETIKPNTSVISDIELEIDSYYYDEGSVIYNGGYSAGTVRADLNFPEGASFQNSTPILDVVFRPTNKTGETPLSWEGPIGDAYYLKTGAMIPIKFDYYRDGELVSNGMGAPFPYRGNITAPELVVEPGYTGVGQIYVGDLENISRLHIESSYNFSEIRPNFEINQTFNKYDYSTRGGGGHTMGMMSEDFIFYSNEKISIIEPQAVIDMSMTTREEGYWDIVMGSGCSYTIMNGDGIPVQYPFKTLNDGYVRTIINGDANGDGVVNQADTLHLLKIITGNIPHPSDPILINQSDVHRDGVIDVGDAMFIAQYNVGLRDKWFELITP